MPNLLPQNLLRANSLLPANHPIKEHAIDGVAIKNTALAFPNADLFNADLCPVKLLGYLAWALSVDHWDDAWAESIKRDVCRASVEIQQFKGTTHAVKAALKALGANADLQEWFATGGNPYTFSLTAWVNKNLRPSSTAILTPELYASLIKAVNDAKPARAHFDFKIGAAFGNGIAMGSSMSGTAITRRSATSYRPPIAALGKMLSAATASCTSVARFTMEAI